MTNTNIALPAQTEVEPREGDVNARRITTNYITTPPIGAFVCRFQGFTAPPFSTEYLLKYDFQFDWRIIVNPWTARMRMFTQVLGHITAPSAIVPGLRAEKDSKEGMS